MYFQSIRARKCVATRTLGYIKMAVIHYHTLQTKNGDTRNLYDLWHTPFSDNLTHVQHWVLNTQQVMFRRTVWKCMHCLSYNLPHPHPHSISSPTPSLHLFTHTLTPSLHLHPHSTSSLTLTPPLHSHPHSTSSPTPSLSILVITPHFPSSSTALTHFQLAANFIHIYLYSLLEWIAITAWNTILHCLHLFKDWLAISKFLAN